MIENFLTFVNKNLSKKNKLGTLLYIFFGIIQSVLDLIAFSLIIPILLFAVNQDFINFDNRYLNFLYSLISPYFENVTMLFFIVFIVFLIKYFFSILISIFQIRFTYNLTASIRSLLLSNYLSLDYDKIFQMKSNIITNQIILNVLKAVEVFFINSLSLIKSIIHILIFVIFLLFININITLIIGFITVSFLIIYYFLIKNKILNFGKKRFDYDSIFVKSIQEIYDGFHIIKLFNLEKKVYDLFREKVLNYARITSVYRFLITFPKISKEIILLVILIILFFTLNYLGYSDAYIANYITVFGVIGLRLFPQLILIFNNIGNIKNTEFSMKILNQELQKIKKDDKKKLQEINVNEKIELKNISFSYSNETEIFKNLDFTLKTGEIIGIEGKNGIGKSTFLKIVSGLLKPSSGEIYLDDKKLINSNLYTWKNSISYVEQNVFLFNNTILHNIILDEKGEPNSNHEKITNIIKGTNLSDFIKSNDNGLNTIILENTSNISGGEKQKIGISRAIFKKAKFLLLDESLSNIDENSIIIILKYLKTLKSKGILIISHNKKILDICDKIYNLEIKKYIK